MASPTRILGLDPGLRKTGWGLIVAEGQRLSYVASGAVTSDDALSLAERLKQIHLGVIEVLEGYTVDEAAIEETFVNKNPASTLKLGQARGAVMLAPALKGISVAEYAPNQIKKSVVGVGHADKTQIHTMIKVLLPLAKPETADAADALAVAITHAHLRAHLRGNLG